MSGKWTQTTRVGPDRIELMDVFSGHTVDMIILAREACSRLDADGLSQVELTQEGENYSIRVKVRK